jgi:hypothetical protein
LAGPATAAGTDDPAERLGAAGAKGPGCGDSSEVIFGSGGNGDPGGPTCPGAPRSAI